MSTIEVATLQAAPKADQVISHADKTYTTVKEGLAYILVPSQPNGQQSVQDKDKSQQDGQTQSQQVFYNPIQQFNRDLSVLAIKAFGQDLCQRRLTKGRHTKSKNKKKAAHANGAQQIVDDTESGPDRENHKRRKGNDGNVLPVENEDEREIDHIVDANNNRIAATAEAQPVQEKPRQAPFRILDALSATGLRALRYAHEIDVATSITANDLMPTATEAIALNVEHNNLQAKIKPVTSDARAHMYHHAFMPGNAKYDVIDLDPYGTAAPFLDSAVQAVNDGGLLCVTCTDAGVWASSGYLEKTYALYGGLPIKGLHSHEGGLRLILHAIATTAAKYGQAIEPLLSLSIDFYARVFVKISRKPADVKLLAGKTMFVHQCDSGCGAWKTQPLARNNVKLGKTGQENYKFTAAQSIGSQYCEFCGCKTHIAGPMWGGLLHNPFFITKILDGLDELDDATYATKGRIEGMLSSALDELDVLPEIDKYKTSKDKVESATLTGVAPESDAKLDHGAEITGLPVDHSSEGMEASHLIHSLPASLIDPCPFFFVPAVLSKVLHCMAPPEAAIKGALRHMGYITTRSHTKPGCIKTQAPWSVIWHVMREWVRQRSPIKRESHKAGAPGYAILGLAKDDVANNPTEQPNTTASIIDDQHGDAVTKHHTDAAKSVQSSTTRAQPIEAREVVFDMVLGRDDKDYMTTADGKRKKKLTRYQMNPRANWGPMTKAKNDAVKARPGKRNAQGEPLESTATDVTSIS